jgi:DNA repair photolyase
VEEKYQLSRQCLELLAQANWPATIQTRSPLVLRDLDILKIGDEFEVGFSITTADDQIRRLFEPLALSIDNRINALDELHLAGIKTFVMIAPMLPGSEDLPSLLAGKTDKVILDRMNYHHADWVYRRFGLEDKMTDQYFDQTTAILTQAFKDLEIKCC